MSGKKTQKLCLCIPTSLHVHTRLCLALVPAFALCRALPCRAVFCSLPCRGVQVYVCRFFENESKSAKGWQELEVKEGKFVDYTFPGGNAGGSLDFPNNASHKSPQFVLRCHGDETTFVCVFQQADVRGQSSADSRLQKIGVALYDNKGARVTCVCVCLRAGGGRMHSNA